MLIDICVRGYSILKAEASWKEWTEHVPCPHCGSGEGYLRHGAYTKYHYRHRLKLLRVRCRSCGRTHALIPAFSLPGTSLGTAEVEQFVAARSTGRSRRESGKALCARGVAFEYLRRIEGMVIAAIHRARALFAGLAPEVAGVYRWLAAATAGHPHPLVTLNGMSIVAAYGGGRPLFHETRER